MDEEVKLCLDKISTLQCSAESQQAALSKLRGSRDVIQTSSVVSQLLAKELWLQGEMELGKRAWWLLGRWGPQTKQNCFPMLACFGESTQTGLLT